MAQASPCCHGAGSQVHNTGMTDWAWTTGQMQVILVAFWPGRTESLCWTPAVMQSGPTPLRVGLPAEGVKLLGNITVKQYQTGSEAVVCLSGGRDWGG